jgi:hypothetical protein
MKTDFEAVWARIKSHESEKFETKTGLPFSYEIDGLALIPSRTNYRLSRKDIERAYKELPLEGPGDIASLVRGSAYIWAILHDKRISKDEW